MTMATMAAPKSGAMFGIDRLFLALALIATAILVALVLFDGQPASAALILGGFGLGIAFLKAEFSYTASWRRFLTRGEAGGLLSGLIVIAITTLAVVPVAALKQNFGGAIAPLGPSLRFGAEADRTVVLCRRQRIRQPVAAVGPLARRHRSHPGLRLSRPLGRTGGDAGEHRARRRADRRGRQAARRQFHAVTQLCDRRHRHRAAVRRRVHRRRPSLERDLRLHGLGRQNSERARLRFLARGILAMAGTQARARRVGAVRYLESHGLRHAVRRHGGGRRRQAIRAHGLAAGQIAAGRRPWRLADGLGRAARLRLQYRRLCRWRGVGLAARLGVVCRRAARLPDRHPPAAAVRPVARLGPCARLTSSWWCSRWRRLSATI